MNGRCYLCHHLGPVERHHVFGGSYRKTCDKLGLTIDLCPDCHRFLHSGYCIETKRQIRREVQLRAMEEHNWTMDEWLSIFNKSWI